MQKQNTVSFSALCVQLHAPLKNPRNSWCAVSQEWRRAVFSVWADELLDGRYVLLEHGDAPYKSLPGGKEMRRVINDVMQHGYEALGVVCEAKDPSATPRVRKRFIEDRLLVLRLTDEEDGLVAYSVGEVLTENAKHSRSPAVRAVSSAIDDLDSSPGGAEFPARSTRHVQGYLRDAAVRRFVIERANGKCEYCGMADFLLPNGTPYLEAHHIIDLARQGPDTPRNVIALCASHHREAHYGANADGLEQEFERQLAKLFGGGA